MPLSPETDNSYNTLAGYHGLLDKKITVRVIIAPTRKDYDKLLSEELGLSTEIPSKKSEVMRVRINDILILSTFAYGQEASIKYKREEYYKGLIESMNKVFETFLSI